MAIGGMFFHDIAGRHATAKRERATKMVWAPKKIFKKDWKLACGILSWRSRRSLWIAAFVKFG